MKEGVQRALARLERAVKLVLVVLIWLVVLLATAELGWIIVIDILSPPRGLLGIDELLDIFGFFLLILIGIELVETVRAYVDDQRVRVETVLLVGLIAIGRKLIVLDLSKTSGLTILGLAAVLLALAASYHLLKAKRDSGR